jgi:hypothetical protein
VGKRKLSVGDVSRNDLPGKVQRGEITPADAESQAEGLGLGKLASDPDSQPQLELPPLVKPEGPGYMPLYCAAQWIATCGGFVNFDPSDEDFWKPAYEQLLARVASEEIKVIGTRDGKRQPVPGYHFAGCRVDYPFSDTPFGLLVSEDLFLWSVVYLDEEHWLKGHGDCLEDRHGPQWKRLMVLKADVAKCWPFEQSRTGAPGRPSSMHLVEVEFDARCARNEVAATLADEARYLASWLRSAAKNWRLIRVLAERSSVYLRRMSQRVPAETPQYHRALRAVARGFGFCPASRSSGWIFWRQAPD